jgi:mRNA interferase RelE/StbE
LPTYELKFGKEALRDWRALDSSVRKQFERKLAKVVENPHILSAKMHGFENSYRLKLRKVGYRLGYKVFDREVVVLVIAVGRRDKDKVYKDFALNYQEEI